MKTTKDTIHFLGAKIDSMLKRPQMYAESASSLEIQVISLLEVAMFIFGREELRIVDEWRKFVHKEIGYKGPFLVARYLYHTAMMRDDWTQLCELLAKFQYSLLKNEPVPVPA